MSVEPDDSGEIPSLPLNGRAIALLTAGHSQIDLTQGAVAALMPFFVVQHQLGYAAAAAIVLASSLASTIVQPLFGYYADRASAPWLLPASVLAAGIGLVGAALAPSYGLTLVAVAVSGLGVAAFHPEAARLVHFAAGSRLTTGMSYFSVGGGLGFAAAPLLVAALLALAGTSGLLVLLAPALILALLFAMNHARLAGLTRRHHSHGTDSTSLPPAQWGAFAVLGVTIAVRSAVFVGLNAFLALYWVHHLGQSASMGNVALSIVLGASVVGTLIGGRLADRYSRRGVLRWGLLVSSGLLGLLAAADNPMLALALLAPAGILFALASSPLIVLGQQYLPGRIGVASGVTIGVAVSFGGIAAPLLGLAADAHGIGIMPWLLTILALVASGLAFLLPRPANRMR